MLAVPLQAHGNKKHHFLSEDENSVHVNPAALIQTKGALKAVGLLLHTGVFGYLTHYNCAQVEVEGQQSAPADLSHVWAPTTPLQEAAHAACTDMMGPELKGQPWPAAGAGDLLQFLGAFPVYAALNHTDVIRQDRKLQNNPCLATATHSEVIFFKSSKKNLLMWCQNIDKRQKQMQTIRKGEAAAGFH